MELPLYLSISEAPGITGPAYVAVVSNLTTTDLLFDASQNILYIADYISGQKLFTGIYTIPALSTIYQRITLSLVPRADRNNIRAFLVDSNNNVLSNVTTVIESNF